MRAQCVVRDEARLVRVQARGNVAVKAAAPAAPARVAAVLAVGQRAQAAVALAVLDAGVLVAQRSLGFMALLKNNASETTLIFEQCIQRQ